MTPGPTKAPNRGHPLALPVHFDPARRAERLAGEEKCHEHAQHEQRGLAEQEPLGVPKRGAAAEHREREPGVETSAQRRSRRRTVVARGRHVGDRDLVEQPGRHRDQHERQEHEQGHVFGAEVRAHVGRRQPHGGAADDARPELVRGVRQSDPEADVSRNRAEHRDQQGHQDGAPPACPSSSSWPGRRRPTAPRTRRAARTRAGSRVRSRRRTRTAARRPAPA